MQQVIQLIEKVLKLPMRLNIRLTVRNNFYECNSSRHYKCKILFTEEFQSI